jgi:hypothetical protein
LLKELCGDDAKLYDLLSRSLYFDPIAALPNADLESLIEEAEKGVKDEDYREARRKYMRAMDKAIFEATQDPGERSRYIRVIQDLASKTVKVTEKVKEIVENEGPSDYASSARSRFEGSIRKCEFLSERIEDVIKIASLFYNERLEVLGANGRREARRQERRDVDRKEEMEDNKAKEMREARRKGMGIGESRKAEREDKEEEKKEKERREARRKGAIESEREEKRMDEREKERREARRKEK